MASVCEWTRRVTALAALLSAAGCINWQQYWTNRIQNAKPRVLEDEGWFKDQTRIRLESMTVYGTADHRIEVSSVCLVDHPPNSIKPVCSLSFVSYSPDWLFLSNRDVTVLVDGERLEFGAAERKAQTRASVNPLDGTQIVSAVERLFVPMDRPTMWKIGAAKSAEAQVGPFTFTLPRQHREGIAETATKAGQAALRLRQTAAAKNPAETPAAEAGRR